jgi:hypothetical protein
MQELRLPDIRGVCSAISQPAMTGNYIRELPLTVLPLTVHPFPYDSVSSQIFIQVSRIATTHGLKACN